MAQETFGKVEEVTDADGAIASPAADETQRSLHGNFGTGNDGDATDDTTGSTLPAATVPEGVKVVVQAKNGNGSIVKVGLTASPTLELNPGDSVSYRVEDTSQINIVATTSGEGVNFSHEQEV